MDTKIAHRVDIFLDSNKVLTDLLLPEGAGK